MERRLRIPTMEIVERHLSGGPLADLGVLRMVQPRIRLPPGNHSAPPGDYR
jgi:hypothetical protein